MCECGPKGNRKGLLALRGEESLRTTPMPIEWPSEQGQMEAADERACDLQAATRSRPGPYNRLDGGRTGPAAGDVFRGVVEIPPQPPDKVGEHDGG